jgi:hypothetical protein
MSGEPSQFIVPQYLTSDEGFESGSGSGSGGSGSGGSGSGGSVSGGSGGSGSASKSVSATASAAPTKEIHIDEIIKRDDVTDIDELEAALESIPADGKPPGAGVVDSIFGFFSTVVELIKYIFSSLSSAIGIDEFQFGYIVLGLGALFMTLPLWGEPRLKQSPLPRNTRNGTVYTVIGNNKGSSLQPQVE